MTAVTGTYLEPVVTYCMNIGNLTSQAPGASAQRFETCLHARVLIPESQHALRWNGKRIYFDRVDASPV